MEPIIILALLASCGWLLRKLSVANKDNSDLRARNESLKRQLARVR